MRKLLIFLMALIATIGVQARPRARINIMTLPPYERVVQIIKTFETHLHLCHWPTICYGHVVQRGERFAKRQYTEREADALLRHDLKSRFHSSTDSESPMHCSLLFYPTTLGPVQYRKATSIRNCNPAIGTSSRHTLRIATPEANFIKISIIAELQN